ncbi:MAG: RDD family protein [Acidobacteriota bacterium]|nr:RDD family protein [Acidobacteriota bacterium]
MMNDSVREELALKISPIVKSTRPAIQKEIPKPPIAPPSPAPVQPKPAQQAPPMQMQNAVIHTSIQPEYKAAESIEQPVFQPKPAMQTPVQQQQQPPQQQTQQPVIQQNPVQPSPPQPQQRAAQTLQTSEIASKATSPTLVDFRHKNAVVPEWRLHLQNAVRKRQDRGGNNSSSSSSSQTQVETVSTVVAAPQPVTLATSGATALQAEPLPQSNLVVSGNPKLEAAMRRIEQSRQLYYAGEEKPKPQLAAVPQAQPQMPSTAQPKTFPYAVPSQSPLSESQPPAKPESIAAKIQPKTFIIEKKAETVAAERKIEKFDTNKLPPLSQVTKTTVDAETRPSGFFKAVENKIEIKAPLYDDDAADDEADDVTVYAEAAEDFAPEAEAEVAVELEEIEDCAPVSLRFNAGLFDLIIGSFLSFILLSPFMLLNGNLFTLQGLLAFLATFAIVMFIYMTVTIGFLGRTLGMRLFSLEIIDVEENAYPTFHQAAVNSCVYLFSLALGGIGFLPLFFNSEKRAAHDLLAGTIVVREEY